MKSDKPFGLELVQSTVLSQQQSVSRTCIFTGVIWVFLDSVSTGVAIVYTHVKPDRGKVYLLWNPVTLFQSGIGLSDFRYCQHHISSYKSQNFGALQDSKRELVLLVRRQRLAMSEGCVQGRSASWSLCPIVSFGISQLSCGGTTCSKKSLCPPLALPFFFSCTYIFYQKKKKLKGNFYKSLGNNNR